MKKSFSNKKNNKRLSKARWAMSAILLFAIVTAGYVSYTYINKKSAPKPSGPTTEQIKQASDIDSNNKKNAIDSPTNTTNSTPSVSNTESSIDITAIKENNSTVTIITKLKRVSSGTCQLSISNGLKTTAKSATIIYQSDFSTCAGFSIPISEIGVGSWQINLSLSGGSNAESKSIILEVN
jgi:cytoskeletal protein RodZ